MLTGYLENTEFLSHGERAALLATLTSAQCAWDVRRDADNAARGKVLQLTPSSKASESFLRVAQLLASRCWEWLRRDGVALPDGRTTHVQCFPVWMEGDPHAPPHQEPHVDGSDIEGRARTPLLTTIYYVLAEHLEGGDFIGYRNVRPLAEEFRVAPKTNAIIAVRGNQVHGVGPLHKGHRLSMVTNLYNLG